MSFQLTGKIKSIGEVEVKSEKFRLRNFVVTMEDEKYPQHIQMQLSNDKCEVLNSFNIGDSVNVSFNLRGREWASPQGEVKYFNSVEAWKIDSISAPAPNQNSPTNHSEMPVDMGHDDLPF